MARPRISAAGGGEATGKRLTRSSRPAKPKAGRPTVADAIRLEAAILRAATELFLRDGYASTSIEGIAKACSVAKRTIYARWSGKPALFRAVVERLMARWLALSGDWDAAPPLETALRHAADRIMAVALTSEAVALHRLLTAESGRFPELPRLMHEAGTDTGTDRIAALLDSAIARREVADHDTAFAAEQFMHLLLAGPQRRALGLASPMGAAQSAAWRDNAIRLFLGGLNSLRLLPPPEE